MFNQLSETVIELYRRYAGQWDAARRASVWNDRGWLEAFARELGRGNSVLDLCCGGGEPVARFLVGKGFRVTGVDASPDMIAFARERLPDQEWIIADMRHPALGRRFDGILGGDSYFHVSHPAQPASGWNLRQVSRAWVPADAQLGFDHAATARRS